MSVDKLKNILSIMVPSFPYIPELNYFMFMTDTN